MKEQLKKTIEALKERVKYNLSIIHNNERDVRIILEESVSTERSRKLEQKYNENKRLLQENNDAIQLQLQLTKFIEAYKAELDTYDINPEHPYVDEETASDSYIITREEYINLTIKGEIKFNYKHPYFDDEEFFNDLLDYYTSIEDYETCDFLVKRKKDTTK